VTLRALQLRRDALVARSAAQRSQLIATVSRMTDKVAIAQGVAAGLHATLTWALRLMPVYALLRRLKR
jgi:hypothetical protein